MSTCRRNDNPFRSIYDSFLVPELFDLLANQGKSASKASAMEQTSALIQLLVSKDVEIQVHGGVFIGSTSEPNKGSFTEHEVDSPVPCFCARNSSKSPIIKRAFKKPSTNYSGRWIANRFAERVMLAVCVIDYRPSFLESLLTILIVTHVVFVLQEDIKKLQTHLKEAESLLSNAVYQAKQKLEHIRRANRYLVL